ncbi:hypothetical protein IIA15_01000 [candidate division TA06 bacterium]|nr:hypothetical protein [candidate division TA06 bacterium]
MSEDCLKCTRLMELFDAIGDDRSTNRDYWVMTEIFMMLHNGKDYCDISKRKTGQVEGEKK